MEDPRWAWSNDRKHNFYEHVLINEIDKIILCPSNWSIGIVFYPPPPIKPNPLPPPGPRPKCSEGGGTPKCQKKCDNNAYGVDYESDLHHGAKAYSIDKVLREG